jgi:hypothetical protein
MLSVRPAVAYVLWKQGNLFFLYRTGKYGNLKCDTPTRCAGSFQGNFSMLVALVGFQYGCTGK